MKKKLILYGLPAVALLLIFYPLFTANYAFLDEAHQLWFNYPLSNYHIFLSCGRLLTGLLWERTFATMTNIASITYIRIGSVLGWLFTVWTFMYLLQQWMRHLNLDKRMVLLGGVYLASSISVAVYNGWAGSAGEGLPAFAAGLLSGHLLYMRLQRDGRITAIPWYMLLLTLVLGLVSLFFYQVGIGAFLIPFLLHFATNKKFEKPGKILVTGVVAYLFIHAIYYLLFQYSLKLGGIEAAGRTGLGWNFGKKIGFFFSVPLAQTFSFNFLFNMRSVVSQAFYIAMIALWAGHIFWTHRTVHPIKKLRYIVIVFVLLMLVYLPVLAGHELFAPYRTMICLNLVMFILLADMILGWMKTERFKNISLAVGMLLFVAVGFYNFRYNFLQPVLHEYQLVRNYIEKQYTPGIDKVYFLRPPEDLFLKPFHVRAYRDELGVPSTFKDWTPVPLVKQIIFEITHNKKTAEQIEVVQFTDQAAFYSALNKKESHIMAIDVADIFNNNNNNKGSYSIK